MHGVTVFLSSHLLSEVEQIASRIGILAGGRLQFEGATADLRARREGLLKVGVDRPEAAIQTLRHHGHDALADPSGGVVLLACGVEAAAAINRLLVERGIAVHSLGCEQASLEKMFLELTSAV